MEFVGVLLLAVFLWFAVFLVVGRFLGYALGIAEVRKEVQALKDETFETSALLAGQIRKAQAIVSLLEEQLAVQKAVAKQQGVSFKKDMPVNLNESEALSKWKEYQEG